MAKKKQTEHLDVQVLPPSGESITFYKCFFFPGTPEDMILNTSGDEVSLNPVAAVRHVFSQQACADIARIITAQFFCDDEPVEIGVQQDVSQFMLAAFTLHDSSEFADAVLEKREDDPIILLARKNIKNGLQVAIGEYEVKDILVKFEGKDGKEYYIDHFKAERTDPGENKDILPTDISWKR